MTSVTDPESMPAFDEDNICPLNVSVMTYLLFKYNSLLLQLMSSTHEVVACISNFVRMGREFQIFQNSVRCSDAIAIESIMAKWVPVWKVVGKMNYFQMSFSQMEMFYEKIPCCLLQVIHCNTCSRLHDGHDSTTSQVKAFLEN